MHRRQASIVLRNSKHSQSARACSPDSDIRYRQSVSTPADIGFTEESSLLSRRTSRTFGGDLQGVKQLVMQSKINLLLLIAPFAVWSYCANWNPSLIFALNFLVMVPLAKLLGEATEILALHTGETIGGLVNATFGNAVEVVIAIFALKNGQIEVVQASMIGSCLSNLLFVLGCCFIAGGLKNKESLFNATGASANSCLLMLSSFAMLLPTYCQSSSEDEETVLTISRIAAIFLFFMYAQLLFFQLHTHSHLFAEESEPDEAELSFSGSLSMLLVSTLLVAVFSEFLVSSIEGATEELKISKSFVGIIVLPVVGNAVEHMTAVKVALNGKMELAMGVAVGSATQISLFVVPVIVIAGWIMGQPMSLAFPIFDVLVYMMAILIVYGIVADGRSNWLEGSMLLTAYGLTAVALLWVKV